jgi:fructose-bisphosphate aldolase, class II
MSIPSAEQYRAMLDAAAAGGYAYPAINVTSSQTLNAALRGFAEAESDGIVQVTTGAAKYLSGAADDEAVGARALAAYAREVGGSYRSLVALHTDHCPPDHVDGFLLPLLAESKRRRQRGEEPLFQSQMFDGSSLPLEENLRRSTELLAECAAANVILEVEVGVVGGAEDDVSGEAVAVSKRYSTTDDVLRVAELLGCGERGRYLLAATFGNVHGMYAPGSVELHPGILGQGQRALAAAHPGARFQYVFHGSSGSSPDELRDAVRFGVVKVNIDTDDQYAFTRAVADHMLANQQGLLNTDAAQADKSAFDPRAWGRKGEAAMAGQVAAACQQLGSAGKSLAH